MREILFRGKRMNGGAWVEGSLICFADGCAFICVQSNNDDELDKYEVIPETVGQYTGVNVGSENLFEGDIVEWHEDYDDTWGYSRTTVGRSVVVWDTENFCWAFKTDDKYIQAFNDWDWNSSYIIGNIHDNPELLKGSESNA